MVTRSSSHVAMLFTLINVLCSRGSGFPALGTYSNLRLGNSVGFDGQTDEDQSQLPVKADSDIYQSPLSDSDNLYYQVPAGIPSGYSKLLGQLSARRYLKSLMGKRVGAPEEQVPVQRHVDGLFTSKYSRLRNQMALIKYLNSVLDRKISAPEEQVPVQRHIDGAFSSLLSRVRSEAAARKFLNDLLAKVKSIDEINAADFQNMPPLVENYDSVTVDEFLNRLPALMACQGKLKFL